MVFPTGFSICSKLQSFLILWTTFIFLRKMEIYFVYFDSIWLFFKHLPHHWRLCGEMLLIPQEDAQELCAPCELQQNNKVNFSASNLVCLSKLHFCQINTCWFLFLEISYLWNIFPFLFSQFLFWFPFSKLFSQFFFPNKHASKPKRIKHKLRAADRNISPLCTWSFNSNAYAWVLVRVIHFSKKKN